MKNLSKLSKKQLALQALKELNALVCDQKRLEYLIQEVSLYENNEVCGWSFADRFYSKKEFKKCQSSKTL